jgi:hypothetical protein
LIESIGIGGETDRGDRNAKQAGSRLREIFVVASRFRSVIAGVSAMAKPNLGRRYVGITISSLSRAATSRELPF